MSIRQRCEESDRPGAGDCMTARVAYLAGMDSDERARRTVGSLRLLVWHAGDTPDLGGHRRRFGYRVVSMDPNRPGSLAGEDLHSGVGGTPVAAEMLRTLAAVLGYAAERYQAGMRPPDEKYPSWLYEAAYLNADELAMLAMEDELEEDVPAATVYLDVVFQQGEDAAEALAILDEHGEHAVIAHLVQWDGGGEIETAAPTGQIYERAPWASSDRTFREDNYVLSYNLRLGYIGLIRKLRYPADPQTATDAEPAAPRPRLHDFSTSRTAGGARVSEVDARRL